MIKKSKYAPWMMALMCLLCSVSAILHAEVNPKQYAVMVSAQVQSSPAQITLRWNEDSLGTQMVISRKTKSATSWTTLATLSGNPTSYTDTSVSVGQAYEYKLIKTTSWGYKGTGYLLAGINAPLTDIRGKVVLIVDNTYAADLATELKRLEWDLAGDGWTVLRHDIARSLTPPQVKNIIKAEYNADPNNVKAAFLFGHVAVPYSGSFRPDGHPDHEGAWAADSYYGDMDGNWTDHTVNTAGAHRPQNRNVPGDGKFDQSEIPSNIEIAVGRVDLANMTCFSNKAWSRSEKDLLRAYLNKDHNFRHRVFTLARRGIVCDNFGERGGEAFASSGWRNFGAFFGTENVTSVAYGGFFNAVKNNDYLWSYGTGGGSYTSCNGVGGSDDFANVEIKTAFTMFLGSYFGDWDNESNFLRAPLASGYGLTSSWAGRPHWFYHHMGLGETIGYSTVLTQNNGSGGLYENQLNTAPRQVHVALLGDPTLRMHPVIPPSNLRGSASGSIMNLTWNVSTDSDLAGYHIYRGSGPNGSFTRLTGSPITSTSYTDPGYTPGVTYMVRAVKLERGGGGTYYNPSQGIFFPENGGGGSTGSSTGGTTGTTGTTLPSTPSGLAANAISTSQINLTWTDTAINETSYLVSRKEGVSGTWAVIATLPANSTSYNHTGLAAGTSYSYHIVAANSAGNSAASTIQSATTSSGTPVTTSATYLATDTATQGNWRGVYGQQGFVICASSSSIPGFAQVTASGKSDYEWNDTTTETRALQQADGSGRIASCWYSSTPYTVNVAFNDGNPHRLSLYFMDWDRTGRSQKIEILDSKSGTVLNTQTVSSFENGKYLTWTVQGAITIRLTKIAGANALAMGLFIDAAPTLPTPTPQPPLGDFIAGKFNLRINGQPGQRFDVYASDNLQSWAPLATITLSTTTFDYVDPASSDKTLRFYRAVLAP